MKLPERWHEIKKVFETAAGNSLHFSLATVDSENNPCVTPIGSLFLRDDCTGFYFEEFPLQLSKNFEQNNRVSILAINSDSNFWLESLSNGKFVTFPGMRLTGKALERREGTSEEINAMQQKVSFAKGLKGHDILWKNMRMVRDIQFDGFRPVLCGEMTRHL